MADRAGEVAPVVTDRAQEVPSMEDSRSREGMADGKEHDSKPLHVVEGDLCHCGGEVVDVTAQLEAGHCARLAMEVADLAEGDQHSARPKIQPWQGEEVVYMAVLVASAVVIVAPQEEQISTVPALPGRPNRSLSSNDISDTGNSQVDQYQCQLVVGLAALVRRQVARPSSCDLKCR